MRHITANKPLVSVIVPTKNSSRHLRQCLEAVKRQTYPNVEIIVVDNHSTDNTVSIAKKFTSRVFIHGPERATQVNFGIAKAKGKYVYYTGSDLTMEPGLIAQAVRACESKGADAVYLNVLTSIDHPNIWQKVRALERRCYFKEPNMSAARFWKKTVFTKLGGFDESLGAMADDLEFQTRLNAAGYRTEFIDAKENNVGEYSSLGIIVKRSLYYGWLTKRLFTKHREKQATQYRLIRDEYVRHADILTEDPVVFLFFVIYKISQYVSAGTGYALASVTGYNRNVEAWMHKLNYGK